MIAIERMSYFYSMDRYIIYPKLNFVLKKDYHYKSLFMFYVRSIKLN